MPSREVKTNRPYEPRLTRRQLLSAAAGLPVLASLAMARDGGAARRGGALPTLPEEPWWISAPHGARVVQVRSTQVARGATVNPSILGDMLDVGLRTLTGATTLRLAWREALGDAKRIAIKFNSVGARVLGTNDVLARTLLQQIRHAGYPIENIRLIEVTPFLEPELMAPRPAEGWGEAISLDGGQERVAEWWHEADVVINVPLLKTHQIAGFTGCMKNISHAVIARPARYHANGCSPYIPEIIAQPAIAGRIRLNIMNALRAVYRNGPDAVEEDVAAFGSLLIGVDPVAIDHVAIGELVLERRRKGLTPDIAAPHLDAAGRMGLGRSHPAAILRDLIELN